MNLDDLGKVRLAADAAYTLIAEQYAGEPMPSVVQQFFTTETPALIKAVNALAARCAALEQSKAELIAVLDATRERMRATEAELAAIGSMRVIEHEGRGLKVITVALHDRLCTARVASRQDTTPPVLHCHFCGFCYPPLADTSEQKGPNSRG